MLTENAIDIDATGRNHQIGVAGSEANCKSAPLLRNAAGSNNVNRFGSIAVALNGELLVPIRV
jgi:hypothetical protein